MHSGRLPVDLSSPLMPRLVLVLPVACISIGRSASERRMQDLAERVPRG